MAAITWTDVTDEAPELVAPAVSVNAQARILAFVNAALDVTVFGGELDPSVTLLRCYLAAHYGTMQVRAKSNVAGPMSARSGGGLSASYMQTIFTNPKLLSTTGYGQLYLDMVENSPARVWVVL